MEAEGSNEISQPVALVLATPALSSLDAVVVAGSGIARVTLAILLVLDDVGGDAFNSTYDTGNLAASDKDHLDSQQPQQYTDCTYDRAYEYIASEPLEPHPNNYCPARDVPPAARISHSLAVARAHLKSCPSHETPHAKY
jgi:hypothetical protein